MTLTINNAATDSPTTEAKCPFHDAHPAMRKTLTKPLPASDAIQIDDDGVWHIHQYEVARQVLRGTGYKQAGFSAESIHQSALKRLPILYLEGDEHRQYRTETARFFTPKYTDTQYSEFMEATADRIIGNFHQAKRAKIDDIAVEMAMAVASKIVGLTESTPAGLAKRMIGLLPTPEDQEHMAKAGRFAELINQARGMFKTFWFFLRDVRPAAQKRRKNPQDDVLSYLIERGYSDFEMMAEAIVYGVAGVVTTREFISVALWHCLETPAYREIMLNGSTGERHKLLHEMLRIESVVDSLLRETTERCAN